MTARHEFTPDEIEAGIVQSSDREPEVVSDLVALLGRHRVRVGQIWADNDARMAGRTLRVDRVELHTFTSGPRGRVGKQVTIRVSRMRPTTGYQLVTDVPA